MKNKDVVAFVPIRLNSQRIKNKSIIDIYGRPMFCWCLETLDSLNIPVYVYSNNIDALEKKIDFEYKNVYFLNRPEYLDNHDTKGIDIYKEFSKQIDANSYLLAHCTSPFVKSSSYKKCIDKVLNEGYNSSCTVEKKQTFCWHKDSPLNFSIPRQKTQDIVPVYVETSAAYCYNKDVLNSGSRTSHKNAFIVTSGFENLDIDEPEDMDILDISFLNEGRQ